MTIVTVRRPFGFSRDGIKIEQADIGSTPDIPDELVAGLAAEGWIDPVEAGAEGSPAPASGLVFVGEDGVTVPVESLSDAELKDFIAVRTGKRPHPNAKRATLIEKAQEILTDG